MKVYLSDRVEEEISGRHHIPAVNKTLPTDEDGLRR
jgi:hypothetical protein